MTALSGRAMPPITVKGDHDATIELDGDNKLKSGSNNAGLEKNGNESSGKLTIKDDNDTKGSLTAEGGDGGAGIGGGIKSTGSNITIQGGTIEAVGGKGAAGIGDGAGAPYEIDPNAPSNPSNPNHIIISGDAEVTAKAGSPMTDAKAPAIGGGMVGEIPNDALSNDDHKVTGGSLTRYDSDGKKMEDYSSTGGRPPSRSSPMIPRTTTTRTTPPNSAGRRGADPCEADVRDRRRDHPSGWHTGAWECGHGGV